jgi:hypothetical protein
VEAVGEKSWLQQEDVRRPVRTPWQPSRLQTRKTVRGCVFGHFDGKINRKLPKWREKDLWRNQEWEKNVIFRRNRYCSRNHFGKGW